MNNHPQLSIGIPNFGSWLPADEWHRFADVGRMADDAGIDRIVLVDHVVMGNNIAAYRWGRFPTAPDAPWLEPLTLLAGVASVTRRVRLATGVMLPTLRGAAVLAKTAATLDVLSQGRLELGVGVGWQREEYEAAGLDWDRRGRLFTDTLGACTALWTNIPASFHSPTVNFDDIYLSPRPVQAGGVPLWVAGTLTPANLDRVARYASGWIPIMGESLAGIADGVHRIGEAMTALGRDAAQLRVQGPLPMAKNSEGAWDLAASMQNAPALLAAGATAVHLPIQMFASGIDAAEAVLADIKRRFDAVLG